MEMLNNIWMALSTPNQGFINIMMSLATFVENFLVMTLFISILNISSTWKQKALFVIIMSFVSILTMYLIPDPFNIFFNYLIMLILVYLVFKTSVFKSFVSIMASLVIFNLVGVFILNPYITLLKISTDLLLTIPIYRFFYLIFIYALVFIIALILKNKNLKLNFLEDIDCKTKYIIYSNLVVGIITIVVQCITLFYYVDTLPLIITFFGFITLLAYFSISIYSLSRIFKLTLTTRKLQSAEEYNNSLRVLHDNVRGFKHDFDNIITTIGGYIKTNDMEGLRKYHSELSDDSQNVNTLYLLNPEVINNDGIYNLLTKKYQEADDKNIKVNITFLLDLATLNMKIYEFARILGILLDNAIEASDESSEKIMNLTFRNDTRNSRQLIIIENTYANKDLDTEKIFEKGYSEKEEHTGLGLWEVRKIVKKNNNVNLYTSKTDKFFNQQLEIYY